MTDHLPRAEREAVTDAFLEQGYGAGHMVQLVTEIRADAVATTEAERDHWRALAQDNAHLYDVAAHEWQARIEKAEAEETTLLRFAQHLAYEAIGSRCELTADKPSEVDDLLERNNADRGRCLGEAVGVRWEDGFADSVCEFHAESALQRGVTVVYPKRADGSPR